MRGRKGEYGRNCSRSCAREGFTRAKIDGEVRLLEEEIELDKKYKHDIAVVVDRLRMRADLRKRLADSIETAVRCRRHRRVEPCARRRRAGHARLLREVHLPDYGISLPELEPRIFSFNSPHGACPRCTGLGSQMEIDPELIVPDPSLSIGEGAIAPVVDQRVGLLRADRPQAIAESYAIDLDVPWEDLPEEQRDFFLYGTNGDRHLRLVPQPLRAQRTYTTRFEGIVTNLERRYKETDSDYVAREDRGVHVGRAVPGVRGARLRPESRAVLVGGHRIHEFTRHAGAPARSTWIRERWS